MTSSNGTSNSNDASVVTSGEDTTSGPAIPRQSRRWVEGEPLFSHDGIAEVALHIPPQGIQSLNTDRKTYVRGVLQIILANGTELELVDVGMRLKGQLGSGRTLDQKAAFLLKMNEFVDDQRLLGLNKLALNNMVQDPSMLREQLSYSLFREMGIPAPRTSYARVTLNGELMGLYATVEVVDNKSFLDHWFGNDDGNLYEGSYGSDLEPQAIQTFDQDRGTDVQFADLLELSAALDAMVNPDTFVTEVDEWIDLDAYVRFAATELFVSHWDGYVSTRNNFFVYRAPGAKWTFLPWGTDQTFVYATSPLFDDGVGRLHKLCAASLACRQRLAAAYQTLIGLVDELGLEQQVDDLETLISAAAEEDPRKETDNETFHSTVEALRTFLKARPGYTESQLICANPADVDRDQDGASGCGEDCDDGDPSRYPGAAESCNFIDDDCDGEIDEAEECNSCQEFERSGSGTYAFCFDRSSYDEALQDCRDRGGDLVSIHSAEELAQIIEAAGAIGIGDWWIGLSDRAEEGTFRWEDGSPYDFEAWRPGEPNNAVEAENCAVLVGWRAWNDTDCASTFSYICQLP